jgi:hypothetical protein
LKKVFGVGRDAAAGVAILAWATSFVLITLIGLALLAFSAKERKLARAAEKLAEGQETVDGRR